MMNVSALRVLRRFALSTALAIFIAGAGRASTAPVTWIVARSATQTPEVSAFASVQSSGIITIAPSQDGNVTALDVLPGETVEAGQIIARLSGPQAEAASVQAAAALASAQATQSADEEALSIERQKLQQHLSTNQLVGQATSALAAARAQTATAQANVNMLQEARTLRTPLTGVVQSVAVANGDVLTAGQVVATVQPGTGSWLKAVFYGDVVPAGATGTFTPSTGANPVKVRLRGAFGISQLDGGVPVALVAARPLVPGAFGTVRLDLPARTVTLVPSEALILDKGQWWVMVHTPEGDQPVQVTPGPASGYETVIKSGLQPGEKVVAVNAYLLYHRGISALYQPPD